MGRVRFHAWRLDLRWLLLAGLIVAAALALLLSGRAADGRDAPPVFTLPRAHARFLSS